MDDEVDELYRQLRAQIHSDMVGEQQHVVADSWLLLAIHPHRTHLRITR